MNQTFIVTICGETFAIIIGYYDDEARMPGFRLLRAAVENTVLGNTVGTDPVEFFRMEHGEPQPLTNGSFEYGVLWRNHANNVMAWLEEALGKV